MDSVGGCLTDECIRVCVCSGSEYQCNTVLGNKAQISHSQYKVYNIYCEIKHNIHGIVYIA